MTLHHQCQAFVDMIAENNPPGWEDMPVEQSREVFEGFGPFLGEGPSLATVRELTLGGVACRMYRKDDHNTAVPAVIYFHGGAWVLGDLDTHDALCRRLADQSGCAVIAVDFRRSPEHPFPIPLDDCYRATCAAVDSSAQLDIDPSKIAVAGDSAGGNLAAAVSLRSKIENGPTIGLQVLIYPVIEPEFDSDSYKNYADGFGLTRANMQWFWNQYLGDQAVHSLAAPATGKDLSNLPPAIVITAQYDVLCDEGEAYAEMLKAAGVPVTHQRYDGMLHGFVHFAGAFDVGMQATSDIADKIAKHFGVSQ